MLLYSLLHLTGYDLSLEELKNFRQWDSKTPGHPESYVTAGVETTTGPLGQGFANGVGMAIAERYLGACFNRPGHEIVNHYIYGIVSDGDLMEGVCHEAASLAGHLKLGNMIYLYDDNHISIDGSTDLSFTEDRVGRFEAYGWHVQRIEDGNDVEAIETAIRAAQEEDTRPSFVSIQTHIGYGSPHKQDTSSAHGEPLGAEEIKLTKENLGWPLDPAFFVPDEAKNHFRQALEKGKALEKEWTDRFEAYEKSHPEMVLQWNQWIKGELPDGWHKELPSFPADAKGTATRGVSGTVLNAVAPILPNLIGGSADLAPSNKTFVKGAEVFQGGQFRGRNFHFGVREHGMGSIMNGMALHGGVVPYGGTFLVFADYMRPPIRLAAMMGLKVIYVFTHDSIGLGEDGPTHQPVEHLAALRAIPNLTVLRPCDANETVEAWRFALEHKAGPIVLALTRQGVPVLDREAFASAGGLLRGAYILAPADEDENPDVILMGTGSEVHIAIEAARTLDAKGVSARVVSMPSWELFDRQPEDYQNRVLPSGVKARVAVEAGIIQGWHRYLGEKGEFVGMDRFGASAPYKTLYEKFGITVERVVEKALNLLDQPG
jgi:transketolase